jgi:hypothetical protein
MYIVNRSRHPQVTWRALMLSVAVTVLFLLQPGQVRATNHAIHLHEVMAGANGNAKIQYIIIEQEGAGQHLWGPQVGELQSRAMLVFFDATGRETGKFKFPANPPTGGTLQTLIATQEFANLPGAPIPDVIIPPLLNAISGKVCFKGNPSNPFGFPRNECLSYGNFTGDTEINSGNGSSVPAGPPAAALPIVNTVSLKRALHTERNSDFLITTAPAPINIAGATLTLVAASQIVQGENLFNNETFLGNGRTCASCHVASLSFGLNPTDIQARFSTLSTTFDPQFIGETAPSSFDPGFDFNLNTLVLTAEVASNAPCTGDLKGILTTGNGGRAKVLTRVSPTTYLIYGGRNPILSGTITDGNSCSGTVASITAGTLNSLENPARMRKSASPEFPQGRALILENIDGFLAPPVFRKSPHFLNLSRTAPYGFSNDIPDLRTFVTGAVTQHLPRTLARNPSGPNPDFRLPTPAEQAAMEAFMLAQEFPAGNDPDKFNLSHFVITPQQQRGRDAFFGAAKCSQCHGGPVLAQTTVVIQSNPIGVNASFNTGVVNQAINSSGVDNLPCEPGTTTVGACGSRRFGVPQLFNVRKLGPFFHDASAATLRQAVDFYNSAAFNNSPAGIAMGPISMSFSVVDDITAFLEALGEPPPTVGPVITDIIPNSGSQGTTVAAAIMGRDFDGVTEIRFSGTGITATLGNFGTSNDNFANRFPLIGSIVTKTGSNVGSTAEPGEPIDDPAEDQGKAPSVWFTWSAPCSFTVTQPNSFIDTIGSNFDTVLAVYTGSTLSTLRLFAVDDDSAPNFTSRVPGTDPGPSTLNVVAGTVYQIRVRSFGTSTGTGNITLHINTPCGAATSIPVLITIAPDADPGLRSVTVTTPRGTSTPFAGFTVKGPIITGLSPTSGIQGTTVEAMITGVGLSGATDVTASGTGLTPAVLSGGTATSLPVRITVASNAPVGLQRLKVRTPEGISAWFSGFTVDLPLPTAPNIPVISELEAAVPGLTPALAPLSGGSFILTVNGRKFEPEAVVSVGGVNLSTTFISATQLTAEVTTAVLSSPGILQKDVVVTNPVSLASQPKALGIVAHGDLNADGNVTIADALRLALMVGGIVKLPLPMAIGDVNLNAAANIGDALKLALFAGRLSPDYDLPQVTSVSPSPVGRGVTLTITGTGFAAAATDNRVFFTTANNGAVRVIPATATATTLTVTVPSDALSGPMQVYRVDVPLGGKEFPLIVNATATPLTLTSVNPYFQLQAGATVTLEGTGFDTTPANNLVTFKSATGVIGGLVTAATQTRLTVTVPSGAVCGPVTVVTNLQMTNPRIVTIAGTNCGLQLTDILGNAAPGDTLVVEGAGFDTQSPGNNGVRFTSVTGGTVKALLLAAGATQLHVRVPDTAIDGNVVVTALDSTVSNGVLYRTPPTMAPPVDVVVNSANAVGAYQVTISYDKNIVIVDPANVKGGTGAGFTARPLTVNVDNNAGTVTINHFQLGNSPTGQFTVANITFTPVGVGTSSLTFATRALTDTNGANLPVTRLSLSRGTITVGRVP